MLPTKSVFGPEKSSPSMSSGAGIKPAVAVGGGAAGAAGRFAASAEAASVAEVLAICARSCSRSRRSFLTSAASAWLSSRRT